MLGRVCAAVVDNLGDCITDRCGSHVARRLLSVAAGRPVGPAAARKPKSELFEDEDAPTEQPQVLMHCFVKVLTMPLGIPPGR